MKKSILYFLLFFSIGIFCCFTFSSAKKPEARLFGIKKGKVDRLKFLSAVKIELTNNKDSLWEVVGYEFDFNCGGNVVLQYYKGASIPREILLMIKDCKANEAIADFINIKARNKKTNQEIPLNVLEFTVLQ